LQAPVDHKEGGSDRLWELLLHGGEQPGKGEGLHTDHRCAIDDIIMRILRKSSRVSGGQSGIARAVWPGAQK
jgi:hypothetical protein